MSQETKDILDPVHQAIEQAVIVQVHLVNELIEIILVASTEINERLDRDVRISAEVLALSTFDDDDGIVNECSEVGDTVVYVRRFVDANEGFVEDGEEVAEERDCDWFFNNLKHLALVALTNEHFEKLFEPGEPYGVSLKIYNG